MFRWIKIAVLTLWALPFVFAFLTGREPEERPRA